MKRFIIAAVAIVAMSSCNKNNEPIGGGGDELQAVTFASAEIGTRTSGDTWDDDDRVGISMYSSGDVSTPLAENQEYSTDTGGNFTEQGDVLYYPVEGQVDFYAYYPYQSTMNDNIYLADIADQSDVGTIDFLTASIVGADKNSGTQIFTFDHRMAMIQINAYIKKSLLTIEGTVVEIQGLNTTASFDVLSGEMIDGTSGGVATLQMAIVEGEPTTDGYIESLTATLIVLPEAMGEDVKLVFTAANGEVVSASLSGETFTSGKIRSYDVGVGYDEVTFFGSTLEPWSLQEESTDLTTQETTDALSTVIIDFSNSLLKSILLDESRSHTPSKIDSDGDGEISTDEAALVTKIDAAGVAAKSVAVMRSSSVVLTSLDDLFYFENLVELDCSNNEITEIDLTSNSALETLNCSNNLIGDIDVSSNSAIKILDCSYNSIEEIDLSSNSSLETLNCSNNAITGLDLSNNTSLTSIDCSDNQISCLDISALTKLIAGGVECSGQTNEMGESQSIVLVVTQEQTENGIFSDNIDTEITGIR